MIIVSGTIVMNPERVDRARELTAPLVAATRAEPGNIEYGFSAALDEPGCLHVHEAWETQEAIDVHSASEHLAAFFAAAAELEISKVELTQYEVSGHRRLM